MATMIQASRVDALLRERDRIVEDLSGAGTDPEWRRDRIRDLEWTNRELARLDDFPKLATSAAPIPCPAMPARGVSLDRDEEARRYGLTLTLSPEVAAERDADYERWSAWSAAYGRWVDGRGPLPE